MRSYFDAVATDRYGHLGRVMLASRLNVLHTIDAEWTRDNLISLLGPPDSDEARDLWAGFAWYPSVGPSLLAAFKEALLSLLKLDDLRDRVNRQLVSLLIAICLDAPTALTEDEIRSVVSVLPEKSLLVTLRRLEQRLTGKAQEREAIWNRKVWPWLALYWPSEQEWNTPRTSEAMVRLISNSGSGFPSAVTRCQPFLGPIGGRSLNRLHMDGHGRDYPDAVLELLTLVVRQDVLEVYARSPLRRLLDALHDNRPTLGADPNFQKLRRVAGS